MAARPAVSRRMVAGSGVPTGPGVDTFTKLEKVETEGLAESRLMASRFPVRGSDGERKLPLGSRISMEN